MIQAPEPPVRTFVAAKLHGVTVTAASVDYHGSVTIGRDLMAAVNLHAYEQVDIVNLNTGGRWTTYVLPGPDGVFTLNGGGARLGVPGDPCVVMSYVQSVLFGGALVAFCAPDEATLLNHIVATGEYPEPPTDGLAGG